MSADGHERERLSAYLDGELPAAAAAAVAAHVAACPDCAERLAELATVDERFAATPLDAPDGYFDTYAARVRARIEAAPPRAAARRVPAWAWAVAAAVVLAVVTPLTLRRPGVIAPPANGAAAPDRRADRVAVAPQPGEVGGIARPTAPSPVVSQPAAAAPTVERPAPESPQSAPSMPARRTAEPGPEQVARPAASGSVAPPAAGAVSGPPTAAAVPAPATATATVREAAAPAMADAAAANTGAGPAAAGGAAGRLQGAEKPGAEGTVAGYGVAASESRAKGMTRATAADALERDEDARAAYTRLAAAAPRSAPEWRRAGRGWQAFADEHPGDRRADEARVRAVEAAFEAWQAGGDAADRRAFETGARAYLARDDAAQRARVEALVRRAGAPPR